jgi:hypothetical protein
MQKEKPPVFPFWWMWYALVVGFLAALIILFYLFTKSFS